jgi:glycosyltransferase 2 family protein
VSPEQHGRSLLNWKTFVGLLITAAALYFALRGQDISRIITGIKQADKAWLLASTFFATIVFWLRAWRWHTLLEPVAPTTRFRSRLAATTIGFMANNLIPLRVGEFARAYALSRQERVSMVASMGSIVVERLFDAIFIFTFLFLSPMLPGFPLGTLDAGLQRTLASATVIVLPAFLLICISFVLWPRQSVSLFEATVGRVLPHGIRRPVVDALESFVAGFQALRSVRLITVGMFQTVVHWTVNALVFWCGFKAFGIQPSYAGALFLQSVLALAVSIPQGPGFFGVYQLAASAVLQPIFGASRDSALAFGFGVHISGFIPVTVIGLFYAWRLGLSWTDVEHSEETVEEAVEQELPNANPQ